MVPLDSRSGISRYPRPLAFLDTQRPSGKAGGRADEVAAPLQGNTTAGLGVFQLDEIDEMAVDQHRVRERPAVLGGLPDPVRQVARYASELGGRTALSEQPQGLLPIPLMRCLGSAVAPLSLVDRAVWVEMPVLSHVDLPQSPTIT